ncbi:hypothetical protein JTB14_021696 [Gonioctena quinquepunctata]|nr:hypothetical protein JTB14_021696 [Gonioctena quinquepunctata]
MKSELPSRNMIKFSVETDQDKNERQKETAHSVIEETYTETGKPIISSMKQIVKISDLLNPRKPSQIVQTENQTAKKQPSLAPYRLHPLFHYIKNKNTLQKDRIIRFRNEDKLGEDITTLILKPVAKSVSGVGGKSISTPLSKAVLRQGTNVDILFEPEAVAIAGPGGIAHAESDLEISYEDV